MRQTLTVRLADPDAERVRQSHADAIAEIQAQPAVGAVILDDVQLADNAEIPIPHKLGRAPRMICISPPRGAASAGSIRDFGGLSPLTGQRVDRTKFLLLRTDGWGATIKVDIEVK